MFGVPPNTLPLVIYIGIFCYWVLLHYNMSFKTIASGFNGAFWWYGPLSEDQEFFKTNLPKLSCGFKFCLIFGSKALLHEIQSYVSNQTSKLNASYF